jgi:hypothetical protein
MQTKLLERQRSDLTFPTDQCFTWLLGLNMPWSRTYGPFRFFSAYCLPYAATQSGQSPLPMLSVMNGRILDWAPFLQIGNSLRLYNFSEPSTL